MVRFPLFRFEADRLLIVFDRRRRGIEARKQFVKPVGAWFSQVGRLHQVHHLWQYPYVVSRALIVRFCINLPLIRRNLETRKALREKAWKVDGWSDTVHKVYLFTFL